MRLLNTVSGTTFYWCSCAQSYMEVRLNTNTNWHVDYPISAGLGRNSKRWAAFLLKDVTQKIDEFLSEPALKRFFWHQEES